MSSIPSWRSADLPIASFADISFVFPQLAIGGDLEPWGGRAIEQVAELGSLGVTHIVDARIEWSDEQLVAELAPDIAYLHHGIDDAGQRVPDEWFGIGAAWITTAVASGGIVVSHCHMGINRGPSLGFAALLALGWDPIEALEAIRTARPIAAVGYAEDALRWHLRATGAAPHEWRQQTRRLRRWRDENDLDVRSIIRTLRDSGA